MEVRCLKDNSVMVFVPAGEFHSGLSRKQMWKLVNLTHHKTSFAEAVEADDRASWDDRLGASILEHKEKSDEMKRLKEKIVPRRKIQLGAFYIDKYEVTNRQYRSFMAETKNEQHRPGFTYGPSYNIGPTGREKFYDLWQDEERNRDDQPVTCVSAEDAVAYAEWAGKSIPSRLHWQHAAVGDGEQLFPWGSEFKASYCRSKVAELAEAKQGMRDEKKSSLLLGAWQLVREIRKDIKPAVPAVVGEYPDDRSPFGCYDMGGNVSEWVQADTDIYILIGGNADSISLNCLVPARKAVYGFSPQFYGFRTVLLVEENRE